MYEAGRDLIGLEIPSKIRGIPPIKDLPFHKNIDIDVDISLLANKLHCFIKQGDFDSALKVYEELKQFNIYPPESTFNNFITECFFRGDLEMARKVFDIMKSDGINMESSYEVMVAGYAQRDKLDKAEEMLEEMRKGGYKIDEVIYTILMEAYNKRKEYDKTREIFNKIEAEGLSPTISAFFEYIKASPLEEIDDILYLMRKYRRSPDYLIIYTILSRYFEESKYDEVMEFATKMKTEFQAEFDINSYGILIQTSLKQNNISEAERLIMEMLEKDLKPNRNCIDPLMDTYMKKNKLNEAKSLITHLKNNKVKLTERAEEIQEKFRIKSK